MDIKLDSINQLSIRKASIVVTIHPGTPNEAMRSVRKSSILMTYYHPGSGNFNINTDNGINDIVIYNVSKEDALTASDALLSDGTAEFQSDPEEPAEAPSDPPAESGSEPKAEPAKQTAPKPAEKPKPAKV